MKEYKTLSFGSLKEPRLKKEDPFGGKAILTLEAKPEVKGGSWRVVLNDAAQELLNVKDDKEFNLTSLFARDEQNNIDVFLLNVEGIAFDEKTIYLLRKNKSISSKMLCSELSNAFNIVDNTKEYYFELSENNEVTDYINNNLREENQQGRVIKSVLIKEYQATIIENSEKLEEVESVETEKETQEF